MRKLVPKAAPSVESPVAVRVLAPPPPHKISIPAVVLDTGRDLYLAGFKAGFRAGLKEAFAKAEKRGAKVRPKKRSGRKQ